MEYSQLCCIVLGNIRCTGCLASHSTTRPVLLLSTCLCIQQPFSSSIYKPSQLYSSLLVTCCGDWDMTVCQVYSWHCGHRVSFCSSYMYKPNVYETLLDCFGAVSGDLFTLHINLSLPAADCGVLTDPLNGSVIFNSTTVGSVAEYLCDLQFDLEPIEFRQRICEFDGVEAKWSVTEPMCQRKNSMTGLISHSHSLNLYIQ